VTVTVPDWTFDNRNTPCASVIALRRMLAVSASTVTPGSAAPLVSTTRPTIWPGDAAGARASRRPTMPPPTPVRTTGAATTVDDGPLPARWMTFPVGCTE